MFNFCIYLFSSLLTDSCYVITITKYILRNICNSFDDIKVLCNNCYVMLILRRENWQNSFQTKNYINHLDIVLILINLINDII